MQPSPPLSTAPPPTTGQRREILRLAVPAFGALIAEPLFLLADSAIVGHLGVAELAGVGLASAVLHTAVGLMVFLAYSTTPAVARAIGNGQLAKALAAGRDGIWLALLLGLVLAVAGFLAAGPLLDLMGADGEVHAFAVDYLRGSMPGLVAMLLIFAGTGVLRGLQDTRTPLIVAAAGFTLNIALNLVLVYGLGWSVTGSAVGTSIAQWAMAAVYVLIVRRNARNNGVSLRPDWRGIRALTGVGSWLMLRTLSLRIAILATVVVVTAQGPVNLAAHQLAMTIFTFFAFALDALAIAAQALIGKELGAARPVAARALTRTMTRWGVGFGVLTGILLAVAAPWAGAALHARRRSPGGTDPRPVGARRRAAARRVRLRPRRRADRRGRRPLPGDRRRRQPRCLPAAAAGRAAIPAPVPARDCSGCGPRSHWGTWRRGR